ncbi:MAG: ArsR family transcriptional regulator [Chloroflexi bacterium]|nr:ArsR family transcriptional regulator [Chloroflexota bacterium]
MNGTRAHLLQLLQRRQQATVEDLARALGLASATVRRHLDILQRDQLVAWAEARGKAGRPHYLFFLTEKGHEQLPRQYERLASLLLLVLSKLSPEEWAGQVGDDLVSMAMSRIGHILAQEHQAKVTESELGERVAQVATVLGRESLAAEWTAGPDGFRIHCYNCPFLQVATAYPAVCLSHQQMLADLLGCQVRREECLAQGNARCTYVVPLPSPN